MTRQTLSNVFLGLSLAGIIVLCWYYFFVAIADMPDPIRAFFY